MGSFDTRLDGREQIAAGTMAFHFEKPPGFRFRPGQAMDVLLDPSDTDAQSARHAFSLVSAPFEGHLAIATRMRDSVFKRTLKVLPIGSPLRLDGPFGSLTLHNDRARPAVFIAGGIGITPFMSILRQATRDQLPQRLVLLYSNRRPEDAAFLGELHEIEQQNRYFRLLATMTQMSKSSQSWEGQTGVLDEAMLRAVDGELVSPIYYLVGPPAMVEAMRQTLGLAGIEGDDIRSEEFYGY